MPRKRARPAAKKKQRKLKQRVADHKAGIERPRRYVPPPPSPAASAAMLGLAMSGIARAGARRGHEDFDDQ